MQAHILQISYGISAAAFLLLSALILGSKSKPPYVKALLAGALTSVLWSVVIMLDVAAPLQTLVELARLVAWVVFLSLIVGISDAEQSVLRRSTLSLLVGTLTAVVAGALALSVAWPGLLPSDSALLACSTAFMGLNVIALLLLENLYRNTDKDARWGVKYLCFGLGAIFVYDFFYNADMVLFRRLNTTLYEARGFVNALIVPMVAVAISRAHSWTINIHVSRRIIFHSAALVSCGVYLIAMAAAGFYVRELGGKWGPVLQVTFLAGAVLLLFAVFSSEALRSRSKLFINRNFYTAKYDYRLEWLRFIGALSSGSDQQSLQNRIVHAFAEIMDSRGAGLWLMKESAGKFEPVAAWNFGDSLPHEPDDSLFVSALAAKEILWTVEAVAARVDEFPASPLAQWMQSSDRGWIIVPLLHHDHLRAILILGKSRATSRIDWADEELLLTLGRQAASYLAEEGAANALLEAKRWEEMNKRFAFVAHDVKNVVNQLSLLVRNAKAHGHNPDFQADMLATIASSVDRMKQMLQQLRDKTQPSQRAPIAVDKCLKRIGEDWRAQRSNIQMDLAASEVRVQGDEGRFASAVDHLLQNAVDATNPNDRIILRSRLAGAHVTVEVVDEGHGMAPDFIRDKLFEPLSSDKEAGFGMGVYQVRQYVRDMGGELGVESVLGRGTKMCIRLPVIAALSRSDASIEPVG